MTDETQVTVDLDSLDEALEAAEEKARAVFEAAKQLSKLLRALREDLEE